jgi:hypothetical protein
MKRLLSPRRKVFHAIARRYTGYNSLTNALIRALDDSGDAHIELDGVVKVAALKERVEECNRWKHPGSSSGTSRWTIRRRYTE